MKVRAIVVIMLALAVLAAGCVGQKSTYRENHSTLRGALIHDIYGQTAVAVDFHLASGSPFTMDIFKFKTSLPSFGIGTPTLTPIKSPFSGISYDNPFQRMLSDGFSGSPLSGIGQASGMPAKRTQVTYLGFNYTPSSVALLTEEGLYSTGEMYGGNPIYVSSHVSGPEKVPRTIFVKNDNGSYSSYDLSNVPAIYAYTLFGSFNTGEIVAFGVVNDHGGDFELRSAAPWVIQQKVNGQWKTVYAPMSAQVITPLSQGQSTEWTWDQKLDDGSFAPFGEYRAMVQDTYAASFKINKGTPGVESHDADYDNASANAVFMNEPQPKAFSEVYSTSLYSNALRDELISQMQFKAWMKGLDATKLKAAIMSTGEYTSNAAALPCLAVHAKYNGQPAWFIIYSWGMGAESMSHATFYVIADSTGKTLCTYGCR